MFEKNRFLIAGISAGLPNGRYLTTHPAFENENTLMFADKGLTFCMDAQQVGDAGFLERIKKKKSSRMCILFYRGIQPVLFQGKKDRGNKIVMESKEMINQTYKTMRISMCI